MSTNQELHKVALYGRVSTADQNLDTQLVALRDYCARVGYEVAGEYVDICSGKDDQRPDFERLLADLRAGRIRAVVVWRLDRIGRSLKHLLNLFEEFKRRGVGFVSISQNIDTHTPEGRMFLNLLAVLAEYERELIVARTVAGLERAKREGKRLGRPAGRKDSRPRKRSGYWRRWAGKGSKQSSPALAAGA